jgi:arabinogalactan oligomer / maltooligosaccharide transport system permease protein
MSGLPQHNRGLGTTIATLLTALIVILGGISIFASQAARQADNDSRQEVALYQAKALANLVSFGRTAGASDSAINDAIKDALDRSDRPEDIYRLIERDGKRIVFSTFPDNQNHGAFPRRLLTDEKPLYDVMLALPEDGEATGLSAEMARAGAPIVVNGVRVGYIEIGRKSETIATKSWASPLFLGLLVISTLIALGCAYARPNTRGWVGVGLALSIAGLGWGAIDMQAITLLDADTADHIMRAKAYVGASTIGAGQAAGWPGPLSWPTTTNLAVGGKANLSGLQNSIYAIGALGALLAAYVGFGGATATGRAFKENPTAYFYVGPALLGMLALAFFPFFYGFMLSFTDTTLLNQGASWSERWVGLSNYFTILNDFKFGGSGSAFNYQNFYWTLGVTVLWTVTNVVLGVSIGLGMALLLNIKGLKGVAIYRTLLILPWAIPNYITALTWKGMFHPQFGSINQAIQAFGGQPVQWFDSFGPSFITGLATNAWLSFPFMMVVALGALQAVDEDMYEAARIDGASPWQQFWHITLPSLRPALLPAVIVSVVWTFNMFNVIYLVSAGQPSGSTEILVTRAYKIAFEEYRYGYAAAYSVVIFMILLVYGIFQIKATAATEANNK